MNFTPRPHAHWLALAAILIGVLFLVKQCSAPEAPNGPGGKSGGSKSPISVSTERSRRSDFEVHLTALGTVQAFNTTTVKSRVTGELLRIHFKEGQYVKAGDLLAEVDPRIYQAQLDQAKGKLDSDQAQLKFAIAELARDEQLIREGYIALSQLQTQSASVNQLKGMIATDQAQIEAAQVQLSFTRITAPISGRVGLKLVDLGNILNVMDSVVLITQMQPISVIFSIPQDYNARLQAQMKANPEMPLEAYDRDGRSLIASGRIASADNLIDVSTGTLRIKARFENNDLSLYPNQFVNVRLLLEVLSDRVIAPRKAVQQDPSGYHVFGLNADNTVRTIPVVPGIAEGDDMVIESGLSENEILITEGLDKLRDGIKVIPPANDPPQAPKDSGQEPRTESR